MKEAIGWDLEGCLGISNHMYHVEGGGEQYFGGIYLTDELPHFMGMKAACDYGGQEAGSKILIDRRADVVGQYVLALHEMAHLLRGFYGNAIIPDVNPLVEAECDSFVAEVLCKCMNLELAIRIHESVSQTCRIDSLGPAVIEQVIEALEGSPAARQRAVAARYREFAAFKKELGIEVPPSDKFTTLQNLQDRMDRLIRLNRTIDEQESKLRAAGRL